MSSPRDEGVSVETQVSPIGPAQTLQVSDYAIFYEVVDGSLLRRMQPIELSYSRSGGGDATLVCLHSLSAASRTFGGLAGALVGSVDVVALDLRGFGLSHRPTQDYAVDLWAEDAVKLVKEIGAPSPPVVYGHGLGACVVLALAARTVLGGVVLSGVALSSGEPRALDELIETGERGSDVVGILEKLAGAPASAADLTPQIVARAARAWQSFDGRALAGDLDCPVLVVAGEDDALAPADAEGGASDVADLCGAPLVRLPGGHGFPTTQPGLLGESLLDWLNEVRR